MKSWIAAAVLTLSAGMAAAQTTPVGLWKTIDDDGKTEKSLVRISENAGVLSGTIEKVFDPSKQDAKCDKCSDERKDKLVVGMNIIRNIKQDADDKGLWAGGEILDPNTGKIYKARLKPVDGGKKMEMRGYIGMPMLGRTQTWIRVE
ncbi:DUF2147 domain-containing protein [Roseateles toxinivorans]|uniref:Uncharacterized protein (DUF2147 family) n=1 Tax=Roseateles toxinivorans TaxID=270368 RepID=A0A4R6QJE6_9BURK|nr:DUF2147 domain-containing protein [Roseateles toxinivorans]TDP63514.1 uncharacterized protein (DUF2147 family) [Roseateles toxinivorans]